MFNINRLLGRTLDENQRGVIEDVAAQGHPNNKQALLDAAKVVASADGDVKMNRSEFTAFHNDVLSLGATPLDASEDIANAAKQTVSKLKAHYAASAALLKTSAFTKARPVERDDPPRFVDDYPEYHALVRLAQNLSNVTPSHLADSVREAIKDQLDGVIEAYSRPHRATVIEGRSALKPGDIIGSLQTLLTAAVAMGSSYAGGLDVNSSVTEQTHQVGTMHGLIPVVHQHVVFSLDA